MAYKDPFSSIPEIPEAEIAEHITEKNEIPDAEFTKGNPPRNIVKSIQKIAFPAFFVAILAYMFWPDQPRHRAPKVDAPVTIDESKQASDVTSIVSKLKEESITPPKAEKNERATKALVPLDPMQQQRTASPKELEQANKALAEQKQRDEDIRASGLEAGSSFKLARDESGPAIASPFKNSAPQNLQDQIAEFNQNRADLEKRQQAAQDKMLASLSSKEPSRPRSANDEFLAQQSGVDAELRPLTQHAPLGTYIVGEGTPIRSVLLTGVNSDLPGTMRAMITSDVYDNNQACVVIPKGSTMNGRYNNGVIVGQDRLLIGMTRLVLINGTWVPLAGSQATDMIGQAGLPGEVNNHFFKMFASSLVIGGASLLLPKSDSTISSVATAGGVQNAGSVFGMALNDILKTTLERNRSIPPTVTLKPGDPFIFTVAQDISMNCYK